MKDTERFKNKLMIHKRLIATMVKENDKRILIPVKISGIELALAYANFKCEKPKCKEEKELQIHHLIKKHNRFYMDEMRFLSQRYYWANTIVLCNNHHAEIEGRVPSKTMSLSLKKIEKIKLKYDILPIKQRIKCQHCKKEFVSAEYAEKHECTSQADEEL